MNLKGSGSILAHINIITIPVQKEKSYLIIHELHKHSCSKRQYLKYRLIKWLSVTEIVLLSLSVDLLTQNSVIPYLTRKKIVLSFFGYGIWDLIRPISHGCTPQVINAVRSRIN
jgi:hypothetical protein